MTTRGVMTREACDRAAHSLCQEVKEDKTFPGADPLTDHRSLSQKRKRFLTYLPTQVTTDEPVRIGLSWCDARLH